MIRLQTDAIRTEWVQRVRQSLRVHGYYYEPEFCGETGNAETVVTTAKLLGHLHVPAGTNPNQPVILTQPSASAEEWRPFDRCAAIGWHNDFSTQYSRPQLSLSWIRHGDPAGQNGGAWRVASVAAVLSNLRRTREGECLVRNLSTRAEPFGYRDSSGWRPFRIIIRTDCRAGLGLRFYGRALEEGAWLRFGKVPDRTREIVEWVEEAADAVGDVLSASTGALLIADNRLSLHDRLEQRVTGPEEYRRQAWLCFVKQLHQPLW